MAKQVLNVGVKNNDKTGDTLRAGGLKIKSNFDEIYAALATDGLNISGGDILKTGSYLDLRNRPSFSNVAISGNFYDLGSRPDIGIFVGEPPNSAGVDGHVAGNMAFSANHLYVCMADYIEQDSFTNIVWLHDEDVIDFSLQAYSSNNDGTIALAVNPAYSAPEVDWFVTDGTTTRTITQVSLETGVNNQQYYLLLLDGSFTSTANTYYEVGRNAPVGSHVFCAQWKPEYQSLLDAHDQGQGAHLFVTYDGYGRKITQIIHDSIENEITIVYEAGSKIADYVGIRIDLDQPSIWKRVSWDTNW
jgi:hypothetical protein